jgi:hypothetical protein
MTSQEGHYWIINRNFFEAVALGVIYFFPAAEYGLMNFKKYILKKPSVNNLNPDDGLKRREIIKGLATLPFFGGVIYAAASMSSKGLMV